MGGPPQERLGGVRAPPATTTEGRSLPSSGSASSSCECPSDCPAGANRGGRPEDESAFSPAQRRGRDSNPRSRSSRDNGFQDNARLSDYLALSRECPRPPTVGAIEL